MVFGTFDIFHKGHKYFFRQTKEFGDYLIVIVARDETVNKVKGEYPLNNENERLEKLKECELVNEVVLGNLGDKYEVIKEIKPDVICLGYDQNIFVDGLKDKLEFFGMESTEVERMKAYYPEKYKSSKLKLIRKEK